jgi:hypothetical protein
MPEAAVNGATAVASSTPERVLFVNPPIYDTRLHWAKWQQPSLLLRLATHFTGVGARVRLVDALYCEHGQRLRRERVDSLDLEGTLVHKWRFGVSKYGLRTALRTLASEGWHPDEVFIECFCTFWWEGAAEVTGLVRQVFPRSVVSVVGAYARDAPEHARRVSHTDVALRAPLADLRTLRPDLSLWPRPPAFAYVDTGGGSRVAEDIVDEIASAVKQRVRHFAFAEHAVASRFPQLFDAVLEQLAKRRLRAWFYALGNLSPGELIVRPELAYQMKRAGFQQLFFGDDRDSGLSPEEDDQLIEQYAEAAHLCHAAGFRLRTAAVTGGLCLGRPGEDLERRAYTATLVAHHIGSVVFWPYQPSPSEQPDIPLEAQNGKLFPLRQQNGATYRAYQDLLGLAALLSAKYRSHSFDFLGGGLIPRLFRTSLARRAWEPPEEIKGSLQLPVVQR